MYEHVREVTIGLILSLVFVTLAGVVSIIDPFDNGVPWVNWLTLSVMAIVSVTAVTTLTASIEKEGGFWSGLGGMIGSWLVFGGVVVGMMVTAPNGGLQPEYHSLAWTAFAVPLIVLPLSGLVHYLTAARAASRHETSLRRVA